MSRSAPKAAYGELDSSNLWGQPEDAQFGRLRRALAFVSAPFNLVNGAACLALLLLKSHAAFEWPLYTYERSALGPSVLRENTRLDLSWAVPAGFLAAFVADCFTLTRTDDHRQHAQKFEDPRRWIQFALTHGLELALLAALLGLADFAAIAMVWALHVAVCAQLWAHEEAPQRGWSAYAVAVLLFLVLWGALGSLLVMSFAAHPLWVKALAISTGFLHALLFFGSSAYHTRSPLKREYERHFRAEWLYLGGSALVRVVIAYQIVGAAVVGG